MNERLRALAARRESLVIESGLQRARVIEASARIRAGLSFADRGFSFLQRLKRKPVLLSVAAALVGMLVAKPRGVVKWLGYGLTAYSMFGRAARLLSGTKRAR